MIKYQSTLKGQTAEHVAVKWIVTNTNSKCEKGIIIRHIKNARLNDIYMCLCLTDKHTNIKSEWKVFSQILVRFRNGQTKRYRQVVGKILNLNKNCLSKFV